MGPWGEQIKTSLKGLAIAILAAVITTITQWLTTQGWMKDELRGDIHQSAAAVKQTVVTETDLAQKTVHAAEKRVKEQIKVQAAETAELVESQPTPIDELRQRVDELERRASDAAQTQ